MASPGSAVNLVAVGSAVLATLVVAARLVARLCYFRAGGITTGRRPVSSNRSRPSPSSVWTAMRREHVCYFWLTLIFYNMTLVFAKASVVLQYLRVFYHRRTRYACLAAITFLGLSGTQLLLTSIWSCVPIAAYWDASIQGRCIEKKPLWLFNAGMNIFTELMVLIIPMPALSTLNLPLKQRVGLMFVFALGGFVCIVSVLRLHSIYVASVSVDVPWDTIATSEWSNLEGAVGVICASLPPITSLLTRCYTGARSPSGARLKELPSFIAMPIANLDHKSKQEVRFGVEEVGDMGMRKGTTNTGSAR
ncbi:unnamed protein product [Diplocarpon coronariae]